MSQKKKTRKNWNVFSRYELEFDEEGQPKVWDKKSQRFLKPTITPSGYRQITIVNDDGYLRTLLLARFVMLKLYPLKRNQRMDVDHINRNRLDDRLENLRWVTHRQNMLNREIGFHQKHSGPVVIEDLETGEIEIWHKKDANLFIIPRITVYTLATKKQGTNISKKYGVKCYYQNEKEEL